MSEANPTRIAPHVKDAVDLYRSLLDFVGKASIYNEAALKQVRFEIQCERDLTKARAPTRNSGDAWLIRLFDAAIDYLDVIMEDDHA